MARARKVEAGSVRNLGSFLLLLVAATTSCADQSRGFEEETQSTSQSLAGGFDDNDSKAANTVVSLGTNNCTATLITPEVALTAAHCIVGDTHDGCFSRRAPQVGVGATNQSSVAAINANVRTTCVDSHNGNDIGIDVGLVYLDPKHLYDNSTYRHLDVVAPFRPSFGEPNVQTDKIGVAGWSSVNSPT